MASITRQRFIVALSVAILTARLICSQPAPAQPVTWQQMTYYSYITLTTLGYGDTLPVSAWAQAAAAFEASVGVLYIAILIGRLVGLYANADQRQ